MGGQSVCEPIACRFAFGNASLADLRSAALAEQRNFAGRMPTDDSAGVELFRRAIELGDERAWATVIELYRGLLLTQAARQVTRALVDEDGAFCVDRAFQRFWRATRNRGLHDFPDLASILTYLKMCLGSVLVDEARARRRRSWVSIEALAPDACVSADPGAVVAASIGYRELCQTIDRELHNDAERLVARLSWVAGLSPRDIRRQHPERFADIKAIYRLKRNLIERLRRSPAIHDLRS